MIEETSFTVFMCLPFQLFTEYGRLALSDNGTKPFQVGALTSYVRQIQGAVSIRKTILPGMAIPMLKIRRPNGRLIFNMEIAIRR